MNKKYNYKFEIGRHIQEFIIVRPKNTHLETLNWRKNPRATINANKSMHIKKTCKIDINKHIN